MGLLDQAPRNTGLPSQFRQPQKPFTPFQEMFSDLSYAMYPQKFRDKMRADQAYQKAMVEEGNIPHGIGVLGDLDVASEMFGAGVIKNVGKGLASVYRSRLQPAIEAMPQEKMQAAQAQGHFKNFPGGVGSEELDFTGVQGLLDQGQPVTKTGLLEQARNNPLEITDVRKGLDYAEVRRLEADETKYADLAEDLQDEMNVFEDADLPSPPELERRWKEASAKAQQAGEDLIDVHMNADNAGTATVHGSHVMPGGDDYKELLMTLPVDNKMKLTSPSPDGLQIELPASAPYRSSHYDEPNILAHGRYNTRTINGDKTLFIEEIQSDWHQAGRDKGYKGDVSPEEIEAAGLPDINRFYSGKGAMPDDEWRALSKRVEEHQNAYGRAVNAVPDAPYKPTDKWAGLAFNRMMKEAVDSGHDRIAWTPGQIQADRYDLSDKIDKIEVTDAIDLLKSGKGSGLIYNDNVRITKMRDPDGSTVIDLAFNKKGKILKGEYKDKNLSEVVGKEMAEKLIKSKGTVNFSGDDLSIGGEGMKGFYDKTVKKAASAIAKKFGSKVEVSDLNRYQRTLGEARDTGVPTNQMTDENLLDELGYTGPSEKISQPVWSMKITPEMKAHFAKGVALSGAGAAVLPGLLNQQQQQQQPQAGLLY